MESTLSIFQFDDARTLCWTEENRLQGFLDCTVDGSLMACYVYDADGERCLKLTSPRMSVQQNGATLPTLPLNSPTFYPSPLITLTKKSYTKHYFEENRRICSKIGGGFGNVVWDSVTAQVPPIKEDYNTNSDILLMGLRDLTGACLGVTPKFINLPDVYSMLYDNERLRNEFEKAFYYHSDHLGSAAYLTNDNAQVSQTLNYLPYGEDWVDIHSNLDYRLGQYTFNGKEKDCESGFHYYGARYYWSETLTGWLSVDPKADKYPGMSPYAYCVWNPVKLVDPDGRSGVPHANKRTRTITITSKLYFYGPQATPENSRIIATGIAYQWNNAGATYVLNGITYKVKFRIFYQTVSEEAARKLAKNNTNPKNNFIKVEKGPKGESSSSKVYDGRRGYGGNSFWINTRDGLNSTTPSHEYGHGLGLPHPEGNFSNSTERQDIMIPRNTPYGQNWSTENKEGERVVNPNARRVTPQNVRDAIDYGCGNVNNIIF